ncbi:MAG: hypothetical protein OP8BY_1358 [Candidatus Saccharicenans subterraneus]|uniref:Uncharacterized protein n=1 Tax=Candidatus Saccharicenans subterraneus TaxID=2508984 RepID=A0A3E2BPS9_9BACT|nr:MAG: hypothetical protein OP8BY_1358 [Candidatus Saccharicenans subterraneum]
MKMRFYYKSARLERKKQPGTSGINDPLNLYVDISPLF